MEAESADLSEAGQLAWMRLALRRQGIVAGDEQILAAADLSNLLSAEQLSMLEIEGLPPTFSLVLDLLPDD